MSTWQRFIQQHRHQCSPVYCYKIVLYNIYILNTSLGFYKLNSKSMYIVNDTRERNRLFASTVNFNRISNTPLYLFTECRWLLLGAVCDTMQLINTYSCRYTLDDTSYGVCLQMIWLSVAFDPGNNDPYVIMYSSHFGRSEITGKRRTKKNTKHQSKKTRITKHN